MLDKIKANYKYFHLIKIKKFYNLSKKLYYLMMQILKK